MKKPVSKPTKTVTKPTKPSPKPGAHRQATPPGERSAMDRLIAAARKVRARAYAPYSHYQVGSAVLADNGKIYAAANVENASYGLSICAERNAISAAIHDGARWILACAVGTASDPPAAPCGMCRQTLVEFARRDGSDMPLSLVNPEGERRDTKLSVLLPLAFTPEDLG